VVVTDVTEQDEPIGRSSGRGGSRSSTRSSLRSWDDVRQPVQIVAASDRRHETSRAGWWTALGLAAVAAAAWGGFAIGRNRPAKIRTEIITVTVPASAAEPSSTTRATTSVPATPVTAPTTVPPSTVPASTVPVPAGDVVKPVAVFEAGKLVLTGSQPSKEAVDVLVARATALVGAENVINQYVVDPRVTSAGGGDTTVTELVRFEAGGTELTDESKAVLDRVAALLAKSPAAVAVANSYTDTDGDELRNVGLAKQRIDAVVAYWETKGIGPNRVIPAARGEIDPIADNETAEGRAENRRIMLVLHQLIG
jgi:outer membrane protein OmpA-like peptidoglycan-associated protein